MTRILLDTHLLLWAVAEPRKLPPGARRRIEEADIFVSAASLWEVSIKAALGKLAADPAELLAEIQPAGFTLLPITGEHAAAVAKLPAVHADPFDRMLVAQAKTEPLLLLTNHAVLAGYGDCVELVAVKPRR
ncbi:MAG: type II toxin-antitoxin system VapC family toxin [Pirellulales bacterium]